MRGCKNMQKISTQKRTTNFAFFTSIRAVEMHSRERFYTWLDMSLECSTAIAPTGTPFLVNSNGINLLKARSFSCGLLSSEVKHYAMCCSFQLHSNPLFSTDFLTSRLVKGSKWIFCRLEIIILTSRKAKILLKIEIFFIGDDFRQKYPCVHLSVRRL